jgi:hypothetical protein
MRNPGGGDVTPDVQAALDKIFEFAPDLRLEHNVLARELERLRKGYFQPWEIEHLRNEIDRLLAERDAERARADRLAEGLERVMNEAPYLDGPEREVIRAALAEHGSPEEARP